MRRFREEQVREKNKEEEVARAEELVGDGAEEEACWCPGCDYEV